MFRQEQFFFHPGPNPLFVKSQKYPPAQFDLARPSVVLVSRPRTLTPSFLVRTLIREPQAALLQPQRLHNSC